MQSLKDIIERQQSHRPAYYDDPEKDHMIGLILKLTEDICVLKDRLDSYERLAGQGQIPDKVALENFEVSEQLQDERLAGHTGLFEQVFEQLLPHQDIEQES